MDTVREPSSTTQSVLTMVVSKAMGMLTAALLVHGWINSSGAEMMISAAPFLVSVGISLWNEYGRTIIKAQLEVLKAKSLAQAAALSNNNLPKVTVTEIAAQSQTMDPAAVAKAISTLPPEIKANVDNQ